MSQDGEQKENVGGVNIIIAPSSSSSILIMGWQYKVEETMTYIFVSLLPCVVAVQEESGYSVVW